MEFRHLSAIRDAEEIARCLERLYSELFGPDAVMSSEDLSTALEQWERDQRAHWAFQALDDAGRTAAFFTLGESFAFFAHGTYGILNELWVHPELRSQGVGEQVIEYCVRFGRARGWGRIDVSAPPNAEWDRTFAFYQKRGFVVTGRKLKILIKPARTPPPPRAR